MSKLFPNAIVLWFGLMPFRALLSPKLTHPNLGQKVHISGCGISAITEIRNCCLRKVELEG